MGWSAVVPLVVSVLATWFVTGVVKYVILSSVGRKACFFEELFRTGGMPSGHSAVVSSLTLSVFFLEGFSALFVACLVFSLIVIRDSFGVRWSVGEQAAFLNKLAHRNNVEEKVKVVLGHTLSQAVAGIVLGVVVALVTHMAF